MEILIKRLNDNAKLPVYGREAGPGIDLYIDRDMTVEPGIKTVLSTGVIVAMPVGYVGFICGENCMVLDNKIRVTMMALDSGYREEIKIEVINNGEEAHTFSAGDKIAQILVSQITRSQLIEVEDLGNS